MHGLVQEWVLDQYGPYITNSVITEAVVAPVGVTTNITKRVLRGGPKAHRPNSSASYSNDTGSNSEDGNSNGYGARIGCPAKLPDWMR